MKLEAGIKFSHKRDQISSNLFQIPYSTQAGRWDDVFHIQLEGWIETAYKQSMISSYLSDY